VLEHGASPDDDVGSGDFHDAAIVVVDDADMLKPGDGHQTLVDRSPVDDVVVPADDDDGAGKPAELLGRPPERLVGDADMVEEIACDEHCIDALVTGARDRALEGRLLVATRTGAKMTVGRVQHCRRPPRIGDSGEQTLPKVSFQFLKVGVFFRFLAHSDCGLTNGR
jgi:hypothetical protein